MEQAMTLRGRILSCGALLAALAHTGWSQPASPWRAFKMADGLAEPACSSVTISAKGNILVRHLLAPSVSKLDGYDVSVFPAPPTRSGRVFDSPAGQLWSPGTNGVHEFKNGQWEFHPLPAMVADAGFPTFGMPQGAPLYPVRQGRVLVLLHDCLLELNTTGADPPKTNLVRSASQSGIGAFFGMTPARDGGLWISGARGLAKIPPTVRNLKPDTVWQEFSPPELPKLTNLREPREDEAGGVMAIAEAGDNRNPVMVRFDGKRWSTFTAGAERIRFAWNGSDQTCWAVSATTLFSRRDDQSEWLPNEDCPAHKFFDMAMETDGAFWLATLDGLFRFAPPTWRLPSPLQGLASSVHCLTEDHEGRLWFVTGGELHSLQDEEHRTFSFPEAWRRPMQAANTAISLANGALLFEAEDRWCEFQPTSGEFTEFGAKKEGAQLMCLGMLKEGVACILRSTLGATSTSGPVYQLETYDGKEFKALDVTPEIPLLKPSLLAVFQTRNGDLWVSGQQGVARLREEQWETFFVADKIAPVAARHFIETADGRVWCAADNDLWSFEGGIWTLVRAGFDHISGLGRERDNSIWVASNSGLHRLTSSGWVENGVEEGLPSSFIRTLYTDRRGRLWAGTSQGLSVYHPEADRDPPKTEIYTPSDQPISEGGSLSVGFMGRDKWKFTARNRLLYSHRLDDGEWSLFQDITTVTLADLRAGNHTFQVRAVDRNGNIERKPAQLAFIVTLPWFKETRLVFVAVFGAVVALFFAALAFNRHRQLLRSYAAVEQKVAERTRELEIASRELVHSQKMNALGTLAAGIAHDFNNILSIVKGSAQIIEDNLENPPKIRLRLDRIKAVVEQGSGIVQAMLGFSRSSDGAALPCDLNEVVNNTITLLGDRFLREVEVEVECVPGLPSAPMAKDFVQQILLNFIFNAAESMTEHKRVILRTARLDAPPGDLFLKPAEAPAYLAVSVQDFGCGIATDHLPRIFEPFFTTKALSNRRGTGLGLSMVYELARRLSAGLAVDSVVGRGSTFILILPLPNDPAGKSTGAGITNSNL